ncbi:hypothetical protein PsYK624_151450 [Phanerochaete sordida]|uniref:Uncharacterized protein n=1 Tax=Phanerochaete sordida TaxID=48140 RepID=A0A9P3LKS3_9APHY|nr:hypothetical protein PsYK624_151450 [Phanerochaete sordida]
MSLCSLSPTSSPSASVAYLHHAPLRTSWNPMNTDSIVRSRDASLASSGSNLALRHARDAPPALVRLTSTAHEPACRSACGDPCKCVRRDKYSRTLDKS